MFQLLSSVAFVHSRRYLHRDIKPGNLLMSNYLLKIGDFGLARALTEPSRPYTPEVSTLWYRAPEVLLLHGRYGPELDVWSCACVFFELLTNKGLFKGDSEIDQVHKIFHILGTPTGQEWPEIAGLFKNDTPKPRRRLAEYCPELNVEDLGFDLLEVI
jgi:serine/threonine protein kinase